MEFRVGYLKNCNDTAKARCVTTFGSDNKQSMIALFKSGRAKPQLIKSLTQWICYICRSVVEAAEKLPKRNDNH